MQDITYQWRDTFDNDAINSLHAEAFSHALLVDDWWGQVNRHSLGWACARAGDAIVGFVNSPGMAACMPLSSTPWSPRPIGGSGSPPD
jgi:hypothetical protein